MIDILMSTFNGEKYLEAQIESLLAQTNQDWYLFIRDDGSEDGTLKLIDQYTRTYPTKIRKLTDEKDRLGSTLSFAELLSVSNSDHIMFCDQDDIWLPDKISVTIAKMIEMEKNYPETPVLVFTDLSTVDDSLTLINSSFMSSQKFFPEVIQVPVKLMALNVVTGCTMMINKKSKKYVLPIPVANIVHDQWIAVNIAHYGKIEFIPQPTVLYRQHGNNAVGSNHINAGYFLKKIGNPAKQLGIYRNLIRHLNFRINVLSFLFYKLSFTLRRL